MGQKPGDEWCVPLCVACHLELHARIGNEHLFWALKGVEVLVWTKKQFAAWKASRK